MEPYLVADLISIILGLFIGSAKGQPGAGAILGLLLGPLGVLIIACTKATPAAAAARLEAIEAERAKLRDGA